MTKSNDKTKTPSSSVHHQLLRRHTCSTKLRRILPQVRQFVTIPPSTDDEWPSHLQECSPDFPCGRLVCETCSDPYRLRWIRETLAITKSYPGELEIATIFLEAIPPGFLPVDVENLCERLRDILDLAGFRGPFLCGGIDVTWEIVTCHWLLYAHALAIGVPPDAWASLRRILRITKPSYHNPDVLEVQPLRDPERQISSLLNLHTYFWPPSPARSREALSLPKDCLEDLALFGSRCTFKDFTFEYHNKPRES